MAKVKTEFICSNCGYKTLKWLGRCPECQSWNTFLEEKVASKVSTSAGSKAGVGIRPAS